MNYSFKLSRRMARFRAALPIAATLVLTISCAEDPSGPRSDTPTAPRTIAISPESVSVGLSQAVQFGASADVATTVSFSKGGNGKGHGRRTVVSVAVTPQTTIVGTGASSRFSATSTLSDGSIASPSLSWTATGGSIDQTGLYVAGKTTGSYHVVATAGDGMADTAAVTVEANAPVAAQVTLSPASKSVFVGTGAQFTLTGKATDGSNVGVSPVFAATGGTISSAGLYTAGQVQGNFRVIATDQNTGLADTAAVTVAPLAISLQAVSVTPGTVSLTSGKTQQFAATGTMSDGSTSTPTVKWTATGGTISSTGLYTAGQTAGGYRVVAADTASGNADTSAVTVTTPTTSPTLQAVLLTPASVSLASGVTQQFTASGKMSDGSTAPITATFVASGGTISSTGLYTSGSTAGTYRVIATQIGGTLADTASVTITAPSPSSGTTYFLADAESGTVIPPWSYTAGDFSIGSLPPVSSTAQAKHGTRSFKYEIPGGVTASDGTVSSQTLTNTPQSSMSCTSGHFCTGWYSFYAYVDAGYDPADWNMLLGWMTGVSGAPSPISHIGLENWGSNGTTRGNGSLQVVYVLKNCSVGLYVCPAIAGYTQTSGWYRMTSASPAGVVAFPRNQWVHLAIYYKMSATDGQVTIWQDGVKIMDLTAPTMNTFGGHSIDPLHNTAGDMMLQFGMYGGNESQTRRLFVDDFRVSDYRPAP